MRGKTVVVTGANSGIGRVTAQEIAKMGAQVVMVCRNKDKAKAVQDDINALTGINNCDLFLCDFSSQDSIRQFSEEFRKKYKFSPDILDTIYQFFYMLFVIFKVDPTKKGLGLLTLQKEKREVDNQPSIWDSMRNRF